jgi:hypothetical protein
MAGFLANEKRPVLDKDLERRPGKLEKNVRRESGHLDKPRYIGYHSIGGAAEGVIR